MEKQISYKNMPENVINKGFVGTYSNKRSIMVTAVTPTSIYIPEEKNMEVLHIKNPQTRECTVTFVTF